MNRHQNVTFINDLPDIDQLEDITQQNQFSNTNYNSFNHPNYNKAYGPLPDSSREDPDKYKKYIRNNSYNVPQDAGMSMSTNNPMVGNNRYNNGYNNIEKDEKQYEPILQNYMHNMPNCIQIAEHIRECPICSKFYKNDNTVHIIIIIVLSIMCLLLLKRVLDI